MIAVRSGTALVRASAWGGGAIGILVTLAVVQRVSTHGLLTHLLALGSAAPLILLIAGARYPLQTAGWRLALSGSERPPWMQAMLATIVGNSLSYLTFAGPVAGEPARAALLRSHTPIAHGIAAGAVERALYAALGLLLTAVGVAIASMRLGHTTLRNAAMATVVTIVGAFALGMRRRPARSGTSTHDGWRRAVSQLWQDRRGALGGIIALDLAQHLLLLVEAAVILRALGVAAGFDTVLVFESMTKIANSVGTFVPGGIGVTEGGSALLASRLGMGAEVGLTLALVRRARALLWAVVGIALLGTADATQPSSSPPRWTGCATNIG